MLQDEEIMYLLGSDISILWSIFDFVVFDIEWTTEYWGKGFKWTFPSFNRYPMFYRLTMKFTHIDIQMHTDSIVLKYSYKMQNKIDYSSYHKN